jgi:succinoglycan biosynthesis protein ExoA
MNPLVVVSVRISEVTARPTEHVLHASAGLEQLPTQVLIRELRQMRMRQRVRADLYPALGNGCEVVPGHGRHVLGMRRRGVCDLRHIEGTTVVRIRGTREDGRRHGEPIEDLKPCIDVPVRIVERHVQQPGAARHRFGGADRPVAAPQQAPNLQLEGARPHSKRVCPRVGDAVIAQNERAKMAAQDEDRIVGSASSEAGIARISVVVPMLNEAEHVRGLVESLAAQDWRGELEVLVADGGSSDGSVERLTRAARDRGLPLRVLDNPAKWVSHGLNACIREASGDLIVRLDCHSRYPSDYLRRCAAAAAETGAWNVGGVVVAEGRTPMERAAACAMSSPFGGIGWTRGASAGTRTDVDTITYGAFRPEAFRRAGLFDETLARNQDDEFNLRLRRAGGRIVLDPEIRTYYTPRGSLRSIFRQYYEYGLWKVPVMLRHRTVLSARSLAPLAFVGSVAVLAAGSAFAVPARRVLAVELGAYAVGAVAFGAGAIRSRGESWSLLPRVTSVFSAFHLGYAVGMLHGWVRAARRV